LCQNVYQMTRRYWIIPALAWSACSPPPRAAEALLPSSVAGTWQRQSLRAISPPKPTIERAFEATYEGAGKLTVDLYEAKVSGTAFEMTQHWRAAPDTVFFDKGRCFVVMKWEQADRRALQAFVRALQKGLEE
jgi:hypothetical protein